MSDIKDIQVIGRQCDACDLCAGVDDFHEVGLGAHLCDECAGKVVNELLSEYSDARELILGKDATEIAKKIRELAFIRERIGLEKEGKLKCEWPGKTSDHSGLLSDGSRLPTAW